MKADNYALMRFLHVLCLMFFQPGYIDIFQFAYRFEMCCLDNHSLLSSLWPNRLCVHVHYMYV